MTLSTLPQLKLHTDGSKAALLPLLSCVPEALCLPCVNQIVMQHWQCLQGVQCSAVCGVHITVCGCASCNDNECMDLHHQLTL